MKAKFKLTQRMTRNLCLIALGLVQIFFYNNCSQVNQVAGSFSSSGNSTLGSNSSRYSFSCDPTQVPINNINRLPVRSYTATLTQMLNEINSNIISDPTLQNDFTLLPTDVSNGKESTLILDSTTIATYNTIALRIATLISNSSTYMTALPNTSGCLTASTVTSTCITNFINGFGLVAMRRPLTATEVASYTSLYSDPSSGSTAGSVMLVIAALLQSPDFLYEIYDGGTVVNGTTLALNPYEYAAKMALFFTGAGPDAALRALAANGTILSSSVASQQIDRLFKGAAGQATVIRFFRQWLNYTSFDSFTYPTAVLNGLDISTMKADTVSELDNFVSDIVFQNLAYSDLLTSTQTRFNSGPLATVYGITNPAGASSQLPNTQRAGLFTRAALLNKRSGAQSSPIMRGATMVGQALCETVSGAPAGVPPTLSPLPPGVYETTRQLTFNQTEATGTSCVNCHATINHIGYNLENYDSLGRYRTAETLYDSSGNLINVTPLPINADASTSVLYPLTGATVDIPNALAMSTMLSNDDQALACFTQQWQSFQAMHTVTAADNCAMNNELYSLYGSGGKQGSLYNMMKTSAMATAFKQWAY